MIKRKKTVSLRFNQLFIMLVVYWNLYRFNNNFKATMTTGNQNMQLFFSNFMFLWSNILRRPRPQLL